MWVELMYFKIDSMIELHTGYKIFLTLLIQPGPVEMNFSFRELLHDHM